MSREARGRRRAFAVLTLGPTSMATCLLHHHPRDGEAPCTAAQRLRYGMFLPPPPMGRHAGFARAVGVLVAERGTEDQHKPDLGVPKPLRIYLQVGTQMSHHYLEVNSKRLGGRCRMGLGAVNAAPCVHGRRSARGAVNKRPQAAARANHRRHSAPLRAPHRVGAIHYATRSAPAPRTQGAASSAGGTIYTPHHGAPKHMA